MSVSNVRNLSKTSVFSMEVMMSAPADLEVTELSKKYRDFRKNLLTAMEEHAWGVRLKVSAESPEELKHQIRNLINAGKTWERSISLKKLDGMDLKTHTRMKPGLEATIDFYFDGIDPES
jgi:hypothetical protein